MPDIHIRKQGRIGHITLDRPQALNALTYEMCMDIERALDHWRDDDAVAMVLIDAKGDKAFCAGGDIQQMYDTGRAGDYAYGRKFWADEYRMNAKVAEFPKPYVALMQGFTMGGGVGVSCHGSHRVVCETSQIAMPECGIGLIPDVGGSLLLAQAPGRLGEYLGTTATRMGAGDAIYAGFADYFIPTADWPALSEKLAQTGDWTQVNRFAKAAPAARLPGLQADIDANFGGEALGDILRALEFENSEFSANTLKALRRNSPLSVACTIEIIHRVRGMDNIRRALETEYRFTARAMQMGDFIEGIRAAIIDKDRRPKWQHASLEDVNSMHVAQMLLPLKNAALKFE
jgi:enoyl-CoA hydratase/carnithine racemase